MAGRGACSASRAQDPRFLICADHPDALLEQGCGLFIQAQHRTGTHEKRFRLLDVLPGMIPPGMDLLSFEPSPNRPSFNGWQGRDRCDMTGQFEPTPTSQGHTMR